MDDGLVLLARPLFGISLEEEINVECQHSKNEGDIVGPEIMAYEAAHTEGVLRNLENPLTISTIIIPSYS